MYPTSSSGCGRPAALASSSSLALSASPRDRLRHASTTAGVGRDMGQVAGGARAVQGRAGSACEVGKAKSAGAGGGSTAGRVASQALGRQARVRRGEGTM